MLGLRTHLLEDKGRRVSGSREVTEETLLQGAWYALEQAGRLLRSATLLFENSDWSTAAAVALLGREELGRSRILRRLAADVQSGRKLGATDVRDECEDHIRKQDAGTSGVTLQGTPGTGVDRLLRKLLHCQPPSEEWRSTHAQLDVATKAKSRRLPHDLHAQRMACLYVDLEEDTLTWSRPQLIIPRERALETLTQANNDYSVEIARLGDDVIETDFPEMTAVRRAMNPKPVILTPTLPGNWAG